MELTVVTIADFNDPKLREALAFRNDEYVPCILYLGPFYHHFGLLRMMVMKREMQEGYVIPPHLELDEATKEAHFVDGDVVLGINLFARDAYPGDTAETIAMCAADGTQILQ